MAFAFAPLLLGLLSALPAAEGRMQVVQYRENVFVRSRFSEREDLVVRVGKGSNGQVNFAGARLVPATAKMDQPELVGGRLIHGNGDDSTPWNINGTYIGANHGCSDLREVTCPAHGLEAADLGGPWNDAAGHRFYLLKIVDRDRLWFLSEDAGSGAIWKFCTLIVSVTGDYGYIILRIGSDSKRSRR